MNRINKLVEYEKIMYELGKFGFKRNSISYQYLIDAIYLVTNNRNSIKDFKANVYPVIADRYNTKPENVLWCITKLLKVMYLNTDANFIENYFSIQKGEILSTKAFIIHISYKILMDISSQTDKSIDLQYLL